MGVSCAQCILVVSSPKDWCNERLCYLLFRFYFSWACKFQPPVPQSYSRPKKTPPNFCINLLNNNKSKMCSLHTQWSASNEELTTRKPELPILKLEWPSSLSSSTDTPGHIIRTLSTFLKRVSLDLFVFLWFCYCCLSELFIPHSKVWIVYSIQWGRHQKSIPSVPNPQTQTVF